MGSFRNRQFSPWGRIGRAEHCIARPRFRDEVPRTLADCGDHDVLPVGLGRSYGDTVLNSGKYLLDMTGLDRIIAFDRDAGVLRAEAGLSLDAALGVIVPAGWYFATTPGTRFVTLGGAVANDVHGKNHHSAGSIGCSVRRIGLLRSDGGEVELDRQSRGDLFRATIGGLGLTGIITWVELDLVRIPSADLIVEQIPFDNVAGFFELAAASQSHEHTVAWLDCANRGRALGRGIFQRADWSGQGALVAHATGQKVTLGFDLPSVALNGLTMRAFNALYWRVQKAKPTLARRHYAQFFYPLDAIGQWNHLYGRRGFYQYQCVIPPEAAESAVTELLLQITAAGAGSFLAVLKTFGRRGSPGLLSFPREGATLALDFPNRGAVTLRLLACLDAIVLEAGGRLYPAKDGRIPAHVFRASFAQGLETFVDQIDPAFNSDFWRRVST